MSSRIEKRSYDNMSEMPNEIIGEVYKHSKLEDKLAMRVVNMRWNDISEGLHIGEFVLPGNLPALLKRLITVERRINKTTEDIHTLNERIERVDGIQNKLFAISVVNTAALLGAVALSPSGQSFIKNVGQTVKNKSNDIMKWLEELEKAAQAREQARIATLITENPGWTEIDAIRHLQQEAIDSISYSGPDDY